MREFLVRLNELTVGKLVEGGKDESIFLYDKEFLKLPNPPVLSQSLIDERQRPADSGVSEYLVPFFANLLPEPGPLRRFLIQQHGIPADDDLAMLGVLGENLPGAVIVTPLHYTDGDTIMHEVAAPEPLISRWRFSLAGVQMKFSATHKHERWTVSGRSDDGEWIVKLPASEYEKLPEHEFAVMSFARRVGISIPEIQLISMSDVENISESYSAKGEYAFAIRRFDRVGGKRIHQEDFCQVLARQPRAKYPVMRGDIGCERVLDTVRELCGMDDAVEWIRRLAFTIAIRNGDAHLKNHAVIYPDGRNARLSPAYDLISTVCYMPADRLALPLAGEDRFPKIDASIIEQFAKASSVNSRTVLQEFHEMATRMHDAWPEASVFFEDPFLRHTISHGIEKLRGLYS